jgi:uncharacterized membrane protein YcfT
MNKLKAQSAVGSSEFVRCRRIHLPNFLLASILCGEMIAIARWSWCDMAIAWLTLIMLSVLALTGLADIMANHYREKLTTPNSIY